MRKIIWFIAFLLIGTFVQAQTSQLEKEQKREMEVLVKIVTYEHENLEFNKNQVAKLERIFFKKATELVALKNDKKVAKGDYLLAYNRIQAKYEPMVEEVLSPAQKIAYRKNSKKRISNK